MAATVTGKILRVAKDEQGRSKGFAFARTPDGVDWFLHRSELRNADFADLTEGMDVEFVPVQAQKGPRATDAYVI